MSLLKLSLETKTKRKCLCKSHYHRVDWTVDLQIDGREKWYNNCTINEDWVRKVLKKKKKITIKTKKKTLEREKMAAFTKFFFFLLLNCFP